VAGFKGLENLFIALTDIDDIDSTPAALANLYVGMTRAQVQLWIAIDKSQQKHLEKIIKTNRRKLAESGIGQPKIPKECLKRAMIR